MSLDVYLRVPGTSNPVGSGIFVREDGHNRELTREEWDDRFPGLEPVIMQSEESDKVFSDNITHNLGRMAREAGLYEHLWCPEEIGVTHASQLVDPLRAGLARLQADPARFEALNPENGWGSYSGLVQFVENYLRACERHPRAEVSVRR